MHESVIELSEVSKRFRISKEPTHTVKEAAIRLIKRQHQYDEFWALKDVTFSIKKGESVGIIGKNGSGKSTLFKLISGVLEPTYGSIKVRGRISPMIELTAGFHPELTGIENIYLNCAIYRMTKAEARSKVDAILGFADIGDFIYSPVRIYSSGMMARLGFAIAINVDADILLIDEVLGVGDAEFQDKCYSKIKELKADGTTIVYVSHDMNTVKDICNRAVWLEKGSTVDEGVPQIIAQRYLNHL